jgi:hypothetical protein
MKITLCAAFALLALQNTAQARAFAEVRITHVLVTAETVSGLFREERDTDQVFRVDQGERFFGDFFEFDLAPQGRVEMAYEYTATVFSGGLPIDLPPDHEYCVSGLFGECFRTNGREFALVHLNLGTVDPRSQPPFLEVRDDEVTMSSGQGLFTQSGTLRSYAAHFGEFPETVHLPFAAELVAFSIPESMLAGLAAFAALRAQRRRQS